MTQFLRGSVVRSLVDTQCLRRGSTYEVIEVHERHTPFGSFVTYGLTNPGEVDPVLYVANGHLLLESAD